MTTPAVRRFDRIATNYATSEVHADSPTLRRLRELILTRFGTAFTLCDIACGAGHTALSFSGIAARIVGVDSAPKMLTTFRVLAIERGLDVEAVQGPAEAPPLPSGCFDVVVSRLAPHHFADVRKSVNEMARMARPGGMVAIIDLEGPRDPTEDHLNHLLEVLHDPTHVRSYTAAEWQGFFEDAGLAVETLETGLSERPQGVTVRRWCEIASSGEAAEREIRALIGASDPEILTSLGIRRGEDDFLMPVRTLLIMGLKPE
jgi:ubiquinone/menaquinone biosynthesis C-methylase UbiE